MQVQVLQISMIKAKPEQRADGYENSILAAFNRPQSIEHKRRRLDNTTPIVPLDPKVLEDLYIRWIVACGIAYRVVQIVEFRT